MLPNVTEKSYLCIVNCLTSTYCQTNLTTTTFGALFRSTSTGKERDEETGYGYFGARYMDHELTTMWLSVDPMADKYPSISPYAYCAWNPVKLVDPDGKELDEPQRHAAIVKAQEYEMLNRVDPSKPSGKGNSQNTYGYGAKGQTGQLVDCSGMTSECIKAGGEPDPTSTGNGGGVQRTVAHSIPVITNDMQPGNVAVFDNQKHIGLITEVYRDNNGNVTGFQMIHSSGDSNRGYSGPNYQEVSISGNQYWDTRFEGAYKWDTRPDSVTPQRTPSSTIDIPENTPIIDNTRVAYPFVFR